MRLLDFLQWKISAKRLRLGITPDVYMKSHEKQHLQTQRLPCKHFIIIVTDINFQFSISVSIVLELPRRLLINIF